MRDTTHTPTTDTPAQTAGSTGGLNLSALRDDRESAEEALARMFREQIDAEFATFAEPGTTTEHPTAGGLNLSALQNEDNAARQAALSVLLAAGPDGTGASAIARALADEHGTTRQTVVGWLKTWTEDGTAVRVGTGTKARYVPCRDRHGDHAHHAEHHRERDVRQGQRHHQPPLTGGAMPLLDWRDARHFDATRNLPCVLCGKPTPMRSHDREPVHKVCAEDWCDQNPNSNRFHS